MLSAGPLDWTGSWDQSAGTLPVPTGSNLVASGPLRWGYEAYTHYAPTNNRIALTHVGGKWRFSPS